MRFQIFKAQNPAIAAWLEANAGSFDFAASLMRAADRYGSLTVNQKAAVERCMAKAAAAKAPGKVVAVDKLLAAFETAQAAGSKRPIMRFEAFRASLAPATGKNPGAVYIKNYANEYLGKIAGGEFRKAFACDAVTEAAVVETMADPLAAAIAYGKRMGDCSICGRTLSDPVSVAAGIGPICAAKFGLVRSAGPDLFSQAA